jgi:hypothetical protein
VIVRVTPEKTSYKESASISAESALVSDGDLTTDTPTISGTPQVGVLLTAHAGTWLPAGASFDYKWATTTGIPLQDGTSVTYTPTAAAVNEPIVVTVTGTEDGYNSATTTTEPTAVVAPGQFETPLAVPKITGTATSGKTLTVVNPVWSPLTSFTYQWNLGGTPIPGATGSTLALVPADAGLGVTVTVTPTLAGYDTTTSATSASIPIALLQFGTPPKPTISGTAKVGSTLTAKPGTWSPSSADATYTYAWAVSGGVAQPTGAGSTFIPTVGDAGHTVTVKVTAHLNHYADRTSASSSATSKVANGSLATATPTITGTLRVNNVLAANPGVWGPDVVTLKYQWYRSGSSISGATESTYTTTGSDYGKKISVKVTGTKTAYTGTSKTSASTAAIGAGTLTTIPPAITGTAAYASKLSISKGTWGPSTVSFKYQWYQVTGSTSKAISGATSSTYTLGSTSIGKTIKVKVTGSKTGYSTVVDLTAVTAVVTSGVFSTDPTPTISGTLVVGSTLTASHGTWSPSTSLTYSYKWFWQTSGAPEPIPGATASTHKLAAADAGQVILVEVTVKKTHYATTSETSAGTPAVFSSAAALVPIIADADNTPPKHGDELTIDSSSLPAGATLTAYQWYRVNGSSSTAISGATGASYTISTSSLYTGKTIKVKATIVINGYKVATVYSPVTGKVS